MQDSPSKQWMLRAAQMSFHYGAGSLTALPIVELQNGDLSKLIPTNLISITDGQWLLRSDYSKQGLYPAVDLDKSVSRIGSKAQSSLMKWLTPDFKHSLLEYVKLSDMKSVGVPLSEFQKIQFNKSKAAMAVWKQSKARFYEDNIVLILLSNLKKLCPEYTRLDIKLKLERLYKDYPYILVMTLYLKHANCFYSYFTCLKSVLLTDYTLNQNKMKIIERIILMNFKKSEDYRKVESGGSNRALYFW